MGVSHGCRVVGGRPWGVKRMESVGVGVVGVGGSYWSVAGCDCCCCRFGRIVPGGRYVIAIPLWTFVRSMRVGGRCVIVISPSQPEDASAGILMVNVLSLSRFWL